MKQTPLQAIKKFCYECSGQDNKEVEMFPSEKCPLYIYRNGKDPNKKKTYTDEEKKAMSDRMKAIRKTFKNFV